MAAALIREARPLADLSQQPSPSSGTMHFSQILGTRYDRSQRTSELTADAYSHRDVSGERRPETQPDQRDLRGPGCILQLFDSRLDVGLPTAEVTRRRARRRNPRAEVVEPQRVNAVWR